MRIRYDPEVDVLSVTFQDTTVATKELADGIVGVIDAHDRLVGLEILDAASRFGGPATCHEVTLKGVDRAASHSTTLAGESASSMFRDPVSGGNEHRRKRVTGARWVKGDGLKATGVLPVASEQKHARKVPLDNEHSEPGHSTISRTERFRGG